MNKFIVMILQGYNIQLSLSMKRKQFDVQPVKEQSQRVLAQYPLNGQYPNPWSLTVYLCEFCWRKNHSLNEESEFTRKHLRVRIDYEDQATQRRVTKAIKVHLNNVSPYIQTYEYQWAENQNNEINLQRQQIQVELYRFTLHHVSQVCQKKNIRMPTSASEYVIHCLLEIYKYVLYLLSTYTSEQYFGLAYDPCMKNLAFNEEYRVKLLYPCISQQNRLEFIRTTNTKINMEFRLRLKETLQQLDACILDFKDHGLRKFIQDDGRKEISINDQMNVIKNFQRSCHCQPLDEIPSDLLEFLKREIQNGDEGNQGNLLINEFMEKELARKAQLQHIIKNRNQAE